MAPPRAVSLVGRLGSMLAWIRGQHLLWLWAAGASVLAAALFWEKQQPRPAPTHIFIPAPALRPADLAPPLPPGLAGAPPPLAGIVGRLPDDAVALIKIPSGRTRTLAVGAVFDGWTLSSLDADEAVFDRRGQRVTVALPPADAQ